MSETSELTYVKIRWTTSPRTSCWVLRRGVSASSQIVLRRHCLPSRQPCLKSQHWILLCDCLRFDRSRFFSFSPPRDSFWFWFYVGGNFIRTTRTNDIFREQRKSTQRVSFFPKRLLFIITHDYYYLSGANFSPTTTYAPAIRYLASQWSNCLMSQLIYVRPYSCHLYLRCPLILRQLPLT